MFLKIVFGDQVRRLPVVGDDEEKHGVRVDAFAELMNFLQSAFDRGHYIVRYEDDEGDLVTVSSNEELMEGVRVAEEENRPSLKLHVQKESALIDDVISVSSVSSGASGSQNSFVVLSDREDDAPPDLIPYQDMSGLSIDSETDSEPEVPALVPSDSELEIHEMPGLTEDAGTSSESEAEPPVEPEEPKPEPEADPEPEPPVEPEVEEEKEDKSYEAFRTELLVKFSLFMADPQVQKEIPDAVSIAFVVLEENPRNLAGALEQIFNGCEAIGNHELIQFVRADLPAVCEKVLGWVPKLLSLGPETCAVIMPNILQALPRLIIDGGCDLDVDLTSMGKALGVLPQSIPENVVHVGITCDLCEMSPITGIRYKCAECPDFDLCEKCEAMENADFSAFDHQLNHTLLKFRVKDEGQAYRHFYHRRQEEQDPVKQGLKKLYRDNCARPGRRCRPRGSHGRPRADFVEDVTIPDGSTYGKDQVLRKTWKMKNNGDLPWPEGTRVVHVQGALLHPADQENTVGVCEVGQTMDVSVMIRTPSHPGKYVAYYRLKGPDNGDEEGRVFGKKIWVEFIVEEDPEPEPVAQPEPEPVVEPEPEPQPKPVQEPVVRSVVMEEKEDIPAPPEPAVPAEEAPAEEKKDMKHALTVLEAMGFTNRTLNEFVLQHNNYDVAATVDYMLKTLKS